MTAEVSGATDRVARQLAADVSPLARHVADRYVGPAPLPPVAIVTATGRKLARFGLDNILRPVGVIPDTSSVTRIWEHRSGPVATLLHGVGGPSTDRLLLTAMMQGVRAFVRIGTCGLLRPGAPVGTVVLASAATSNDTVFDWYRRRLGLEGQFLSVDPGLVAVARRGLARAGGAPVEVGRVFSTSLIFREDEAAVNKYEQLGCTAADMETATVLACARWYGIPALSILVGSDHIVEGSFHDADPERFAAGIVALRHALDEVLPVVRAAADDIAAVS